MEYGRLATLPLAILPIPPDSPLAASPTGRARLESPVSRWRLLVQYKLGVQCRTPSRSDRFNGVRGVQGGLRGEIEIFPGPPAKKVIKMLICYLFVSTPQSIAKPSPGWNKVALLTAVRNSPCSCPFSVSLHPPLAALNSEPRPGSLFIANQKLSPRAGKVARSAERGAAKNSRMPRVIPPQLRLRSAAPPHAVAPFGAVCKLPY